MLAERLILTITSIAGTVGAAVAAKLAEAQGLSVGLTAGISLLTGTATAAGAFAATRVSVRHAHHRITEETDNRKEAVAELKADVTRGFDRMEASMERNTRQLIDALHRPADARTRAGDH